jgi:transporter family-2 protein
MEALFVPLSLLAGCLLAVQAGANTQLARATGSPFTATTIQVSVAAGLLLLVTLASATYPAFLALHAVPWWHILGGLATAIYVASTIVLFPRLGAVVSVGLFIAGQTIASLTLDTLGLLGVPHQPLTSMTVAGAAAVLAGTIAIVVGQKNATENFRAGKIGWIALALIAGAVLPIQGAVNGLLRSDLGAAFAVGVVSFAVATIAMLLVLVIVQLGPRAPVSKAGLRTMPWWGWLGAVCGATYVVTMFTAIPAIGTAAVVGLTIAGQQIASLFVDRFGWFRLPQRQISRLRIAGVVTLLIGVALIQAF